MNQIPEVVINSFRNYDTPTILNALEILDPKFRKEGFTTKQFVCGDKSLSPIVGYARTATISSLSEVDSKTKRDKGIDYYKYISTGLGPKISVIQDVDDRPGFGAFWGEINTSIHNGLGILGVVTNGAMRDLDELSPGFQVLAGKIGPSHAFVCIRETGIEVNIFGINVRHNDLIHADRHGAVVIPNELAEKLPKAIDLLLKREKIILDACKRKDFGFEVLKKAILDSSRI